MAEKVLFEVRLERREDGFHYEFHRGDQRVEIKSSVPLDRFACRGHRLYWRDHPRWASRRLGKARRFSRKTLAALEKMYRDIYGKETAGPSPAAAPREDAPGG
jgi:hypothetical protein